MTSGSTVWGSSRRLLGTALGALGVFLLLAIVSGVGWTDGFDSSVHSWMVAHRVGGLTDVARALTRVASSVALVALAVVGVAAGPSRSWRRRLLAAALLVLVHVLGLVVRLAVAELIRRQRPPRVDWATDASGFAFPSGHASTATIAAVLVAWVMVTAVPNRRRTLALVWVVAGSWAVAIGLTRIYLGVHWPTDVLGGWAFGTAWGTAGFLVIRSWISAPGDLPRTLR
ncbi:MAG: phosphatase PAP2 family protein [Nocardioidaceae bacterium]